jgi:anti-sigma factor ChrR (cupin superfamily)
MMPDSSQDERMQDLYTVAAEYILGLSTPEEAQPAEDRADDVTLSREAADHLAALSMALPPVTPPPAVKDRLLATIGKPKRVVREMGALRADEGEWRAGGVPGVSYKPLYLDRASGLLTMLVRMEPGTVYPQHRHAKAEQCLILDGDVIQEGQVYGPGDFTWARAGSLHPEFRTENGNLLLIVGAASAGEF